MQHPSAVEESGGGNAGVGCRPERVESGRGYSLPSPLQSKSALSAPSPEGVAVASEELSPLATDWTLSLMTSETAWASPELV